MSYSIVHCARQRTGSVENCLKGGMFEPSQLVNEYRHPLFYFDFEVLV